MARLTSSVTKRPETVTMFASLCSRSNCHANARAAHEHAAISCTRNDVIGDELGEIRVIHPAVRVGSLVDDLVTEPFNIGFQELFLFETRMIACDADLHRASP